MSNNRKGITVGVDGADATGKDSLINWLVNRCRSRGLHAISVPLIEGSSEGAVFRQKFIHGQLEKPQQALGMLYSVTTTMREIVHPMRGVYDIIFVNRTLATYGAYQLNTDALEYVRPVYEECLKQEVNLTDYHIHLEIDPEIAYERMRSSGRKLDVIEARGPEYQRSVRNSYNAVHRRYTALTPDVWINTGDKDLDQAGQYAAQALDHLARNRLDMSLSD